MNGGQDLGGVMGFGPVIEEPNEPHFHKEWEARVLGLTLAMGALGLWNIDKGRHARENRPPSEYLSWSYYRIWLAGLETLVAQCGLLDDLATASTKNVKPLAADMFRRHFQKVALQIVRPKRLQNTKLATISPPRISTPRTTHVCRDICATMLAKS